MGTLPITPALLDSIRTSYPNDYALRPVTLTVRVKTWSGTSVGPPGTATTDDTVIAGPAGNRYKLRAVTEKDIVASGGKYQAGQYRVGPITPPYAGGPITADDIIPPKIAGLGREVYYGVTDATGITQWCSMVGAETMHALHWYLVLKPTGITDP
jgi:hypothetical protein